MIGIVIVAHGGLANELLAAVEHVVGRQEGARAISIGPDCDHSLKRDEICEASALVDDGDGVILVTDMFGGSPSNLSMTACFRDDRRILYGANLPLLIKLFKSRHLPLAEAVSAALLAGRKYLDAMGEAPPALKLAGGKG